MRFISKDPEGYGEFIFLFELFFQENLTWMIVSKHFIGFYAHFVLFEKIVMRSFFLVEFIFILHYNVVICFLHKMKIAS
jgi:hypothetical protein